MAEKQQLGWKRIRVWRSYIARLNTWLKKWSTYQRKKQQKKQQTLSSGISLPFTCTSAWNGETLHPVSLKPKPKSQKVAVVRLRLACWLFDIRLVSQRGRMTSVAGCRKHVCRRCIFTGQGIYIFVTIYQRNILLLGVYNFFLTRCWC